MILALDLEYTLISNAVSCFVRPHLNDFIEWADAAFEKTYLYTTVPEHRVVEIQRNLFELKEVNHIFLELESISWPRKGLKDLTYVHPQWNNVIMVDDLPECYAVQRQRDQWVKIEPFDPEKPDIALTKLIGKLETKLRVN
jgi:hypothetical protein